MKLDFLFSTDMELNNNQLYSFCTEIIDLLLVCLALKCERIRIFFTSFAYDCFSMCVDSDKNSKILRLCYKHVIAMSSGKSKEKYQQLVFSEVCLEQVEVICWRSCLKFVFSSRFWF